jgi:hypothetical protein
MHLSTGVIQAKSLADIDAAAKLHQLTKPLNGVLKLQVQQQE